MNNQKEQEVLIAEIHNAFDSAEESILMEAKRIIEEDDSAAKLRAERVSKLGFGSAKAIKDSEKLREQKSKAPELVENINYFKKHYPFNKFITEDVVKTLCEKYGLVFGDSCDYVGDIPEKNITEIENFKLRKEDFSPKSHSFSWLSGVEYWQRQMLESMAMPSRLNDSGTLGFVYSKPRRSGNGYLEDYISGIDPFGKMELGSTSADKKEDTVETEKPAFKICAPKSEFKTMGMIVTDGYILRDPIVLQPVKGGYLIVSKWGLEASDEALVNEIEN